MLKASSYIIVMLLIECTSLPEENIRSLDKTTRPPQDSADDLTDQPGGLPYPHIVETTYISDIAAFAHTRCNAWRIEWPQYTANLDSYWIPSLFAVDKGSLSSINYLNATDPANKAKLDVSLYYDNMLKTPYYVNGLWSSTEDYTAEITRFVKHDLSLEDLQDWVTQRPSQFEYYYTASKGVKSEEVSYQNGDFFLMWLTDEDLFGGIRIVSNDPKIIEVYIAEENN